MPLCTSCTSGTDRRAEVLRRGNGPQAWALQGAISVTGCTYRATSRVSESDPCTPCTERPGGASAASRSRLIRAPHAQWAPSARESSSRTPRASLTAARCTASLAQQLSGPTHEPHRPTSLTARRNRPTVSRHVRGHEPPRPPEVPRAASSGPPGRSRCRPPRGARQGSSGWSLSRGRTARTPRS